jgi:hypothetical protein
MTTRHVALLGVAALILATLARPTVAEPTPGTTLAEGAAFSVDGRKATLTRLDTLPYVENDYTKRFKFDEYGNPKLKALRERYRLDEVVAAGKTEFDRQLLLLDWANHQIRKFGKPTSKARGALDILAANEAGNTFFCAHYGDLFVSAAASMGWVDRAMALRRPDHIGSGSTEHTSTEIWSNQHRKWIMLDPTFAMYVEKDGVPLNAYELRQEWLVKGGGDLTFVLDKERKRYRKSDIPVFRGRYDGFGDLVLDGGALNVYAFIGYIPNTNLMDAGPDYGKMFITQDEICAGTKWHKRDVPADPARDPYFPINQAALTLTSDGVAVHVSLKTFTPNAWGFLVRSDGGEWQASNRTFRWWPRKPGVNRLEAKSVNLFGVEGPVSTAEVTVEGAR